MVMDVLTDDEKRVLDQDIRKRLWMIRNCKWYDAEYSDCASIRGRFHQYFVYGEMIDCSQWKRDSMNCYRYKDNKDIEAAKDLIESESKRRDERLAAHYNNDIWEHRTEPPPNWNAPLPEWMQKENENSYLDIKNKEDKEGYVIGTAIENRQSLCTIM